MCFVSKKKFDELTAELDKLVKYTETLNGNHNILSLDVQDLKSAVFPEPQEEPDIFDPKSYDAYEDFPKEFAGFKVGYIVIEDDPPTYLKVSGDNNVLTNYENPDFVNDPDNVKGMRIEAKPGKVLIVMAPRIADYPDIDMHYPEPYPFTFDGGTKAYRLLNEQIVDGHLLEELGGVFFVNVLDCEAAWMP